MTNQNLANGGLILGHFEFEFTSTCKKIVCIWPSEFSFEIIYLAILGSTPFFSSNNLMVTGSVADEEAVPKAVVKAFVMLAMNLNGMVRVQMVNRIGKTTKP